MYLRYYNLLYTEPLRQYFKTLNPISYNNIIFGANLQPDRTRRQQCGRVFKRNVTLAKIR